MKRALLVFALTTLLSAGAVHFVVIDTLPRFIMSRAISGFEAAGLGWNTWASAPRVTPQTQTVVRSSPDLAYAVCLLDLSDGPVLLSAPRWPQYGSLSIFDRTTSNVHVSGLRGDGGQVTVIVATADQTPPDGFEGDVVRLPGTRGLALIRRLAPNDALNARAAALVAESKCAAP